MTGRSSEEDGESELRRRPNVDPSPSADPSPASDACPSAGLDARRLTMVISPSGRLEYDRAVEVCRDREVSRRWTDVGGRLEHREQLIRRLYCPLDCHTDSVPIIRLL